MMYNWGGDGWMWHGGWGWGGWILMTLVMVLLWAAVITAIVLAVRKVLGSGPGTASWPTTWSRSAH